MQLKERWRGMMRPQGMMDEWRKRERSGRAKMKKTKSRRRRYVCFVIHHHNVLRNAFPIRCTSEISFLFICWCFRIDRQYRVVNKPHRHHILLQFSANILFAQVIFRMANKPKLSHTHYNDSMSALYADIYARLYSTFPIHRSNWFVTKIYFSS